MWNLTKSELLRFRRLAVALAGLHLLSLGVLAVDEDLFAASEAKLVLGLMIYAPAALAFGLFQFGTYKRRHHWTFLLHRPLAPGRIFQALAGAGAMLLAMVFTLPMLAATLFLDHVAGQWIDLRHYLMPLFVFGIQLSFYFAGAYVMLSPSRAAFTVLVLPIFFLTPGAVGLWVFLPQLVVVLWLGCLAHAACRPNLSIPLRRPPAIALAALPVQYVFFWVLLFAGNLFYSTIVAFQEHGWRSYAVHRWDDYFAEGTYRRLEYMNAAEAMAHGLRLAAPERGRELQEQVARADVHEIEPRRRRHPVRGQLMVMDDETVMTDRDNGVRWTFRHDPMLFEGRDMRSESPVGWLGPGGRSATTGPPGRELRRFPQVPSVVGPSQLITRQRIYELDSEAQRLVLRFELEGEENLVSAMNEHGSFLTALSDRALYLFVPKGLPQPFASIPLGGEADNLARVLVAELDDSFVLSFLFGTRSQRGFAEARQITVRVGPGGRHYVFADRELGAGPPAWSRHLGFIVSPFVQHLHDGVWAAIEPHRERRVGWRDILEHPVPGSIALLAFVGALIAATLTARIARRRRLERRERWAWIAAAFVVGLPGFLSFLFLSPSTTSQPPGSS